jgi:hypothetical protein
MTETENQTTPPEDDDTDEMILLINLGVRVVHDLMNRTPGPTEALAVLLVATKMLNAVTERNGYDRDQIVTEAQALVARVECDTEELPYIRMVPGGDA